MCVCVREREEEQGLCEAGLLQRFVINNPLVPKDIFSGEFKISVYRFQKPKNSV